MQAVVKKWGNSAAIRIPSSVLAATGLKIDQPVDVREESGCVIIEPLTAKDYDLEILLAGITPENIHGEADFGPAMGQELI